MAQRSGSTNALAALVAVIGLLMVVAGGVTWFMVQNELSKQNIVVAEDADMLAGDDVNGPFSAYAEAQVINKHAMEETGGKTYAELDRDDPLRETAMSASFLRASLFTSVVAFGVAAMAMGLGLTLVLVGLALRALGRAAEMPSRVRAGQGSSTTVPASPPR